jgi:hypothetical protein
MATLLLNKTWVNLFTTGDSVTAWRSGDDVDTQTAAGEVRTYAGGRQRAITAEGVQVGWTFTLVGVTTAGTDLLRSWLGQTIVVRDNRGRRIFGVLFECPRRPWKEQLDMYDVDMSVRGVDATEEV